jgi:tRNA nucleotidyltransferase (CCA-adding enzyme)
MWRGIMLSSSLKVLEKIKQNNFEAYIVGGFARDSYMGRNSTDVDICTNATPKELKHIFEGSMLPKEQYGSVAVISKKIRFDITTYRKDIKYENNRLPVEIEYIDNLLDDLKRRDFIMNTLCIDINGNYIDLLGAKKDIDNKVIRTVGNAKEKLTEDSLRILRAIRFSTILGFKLDNELKNAIIQCGHLLKNLSFFRKKEELDKIFSSINNKAGIRLLLDLGLDKYLDLNNLDEVVPVSSSLGIWAQLEVTDVYNFSNVEKYSIDIINELRHSKIFDNYQLYTYGLYLTSIVAEINGMDKNLLTKRYMNLPIKNRREIMIDGNKICDILNIKPSKMVKDIIEDVEKKIIHGELLNDYCFITKYIKENYSK